MGIKLRLLCMWPATVGHLPRRVSRPGTAMLIFRRRRRPLCRLLICLGATAAVFAETVGVQAQDNSAFHEVETKYIFGNFTVGSSTGLQGEMAFEPESEADFGKRFGRYAATGTALEFEYTPTQFMQVEFGPTVSYYNIHNVPGLDNRSLLGVNGFESDFRFLLLEHGPSPFAVTLSVEPEFHSLDETSGASVQNYGLETKIEADTELIKNRLFLAFNLLYEPETTSSAIQGWDNESTLGISSALASQIIPKVIIGADLWYLRHYDGVAFNSFTGDAVYLGPTFYWQIAPKVLMSAAWETQVAGHEVGVASPLDLTDFSRQRARLLLEFEF
jgi:hypothetical protein